MQSATKRNAGSVAQREHTVRAFQSTGAGYQHTGQGLAGITGQDAMPCLTQQNGGRVSGHPPGRMIRRDGKGGQKLCRDLFPALTVSE